MELIFDGQWVTDYFRRRWVLERNEKVIQDLMACVMGLERDVAVSVLTGDRKFQTTVYGCFVVADNATEIDNVLLDVN